MTLRFSHPILWLPAIWLLVSITAARIDLTRMDDTQAHTSAGAMLVDETRQAIGQEFYRSSDAYFHRGVRPRSTAEAHEDAFTRLYAAIRPSAHDHLEDRDVAEILPWLQATIRMDPGNVEAWRVAAFWLASPSIGKSQEAIRLLLRATHLHPRDYRPLLDLARLQLRAGEIDRAVNNLDRGLALWRPDPPRADEQEALLEKAELLLYRGVCDEINGQYENAAAHYDRILELFPERSALAERRDAIRQGRPPALPARAWIQDLTKHQDPDHDCDHHHEHSHEHDHDHHRMLHDEKPDLVCIVTRNDQHAAMACDCLNAGIATLVTKPWAANAAQAGQMIEASRKSGARLLPWLPARWGCDLRRLRQLLSDSVIGRVFLIRRTVSSFGDEHEVYQAIADTLTQSKPYAAPPDAALALSRTLDAIRCSSEEDRIVHL